ncbi:MAG TPA: ATP-binding protein, partial [Polyangia bacterium]|nr:ATP-binding protein [Polyangia bacterium]
GRARVGPRLDRLRGLVGNDDATRREHVAALERLSGEILGVIGESVRDMKEGRRDEAMGIYAGDRAKSLMDSARRVSGQIAGDAEAALERQRDSVQQGFVIALVLDGAAAVFVFVLGALLFAIDRDIRRRSELERDLRAAAVSERQLQQWFATTLRSIGDAVIATSRDGRITFMNVVAEQLTGWTMADAEQRPLRECFVIINETTREPVESPVDKVIREGKIVGLANHTLLLHRDGSERAIADSAAPIRDGSDGPLTGIVLVFRDVEAERRSDRVRNFVTRATAELGSSLDYETTLSTLVRLAVPDFADWAAIDIVDGDATRRLAVAHVDPRKVALVDEIERRYPTPRDTPQGTPNILRTGKAELVADIPQQMLRDAARDPAHLALIMQLDLHSYLGVPLNTRGKTIGVLTFAMAESGRRYGADDLELVTALADRAATAIDNARLYREAQLLRGEAELANRSKDEFLAILGHELRNPLAPIVTALHLMKLHPDGSHERERTIIERQVRHVVRLVDDLLDVSRIASGKVDLAREPVEVGEIVARAVEIASPLIEEREHELQLDLAPDLVVDGDPVRLTQVMANLINNAAKYSQKRGQLRIEGRRVDGKVLITVRDNGIGIAPGMLPRVFDLFVQEPQSLDRARGGLGLGLSIVRSLVTLHGGSVSATSAGVDRGSEFRVELPAIDPTLAQPAERSRGHRVERPTGRADAAQARLLVVDDNADAAELLAETLELLGYEAHRAHDGPSALQLATTVKPTMALLDIGLPVMDGYELARRLRAMHGLEHIKLVAVTGYGQPSDRQKSEAAGFDAHLVKPITVETLQRTLATLTTPTLPS